MKLFQINGDDIQQVRREAQRIYSEQTAAGLHTVLVGCCINNNSLPERRISKCDVLITVRQSKNELTITEA